MITWGGKSKQLSNAQFDKSGCKGCQYNGGEQALLFDTGSELKGICLNPSCFSVKTHNWLDSEKKKLRDTGVTILTEKELESRKNLERIPSWSNEITKVRKDLKKHPEKYENLIVRVAGYSAYFIDLSKGMQDSIIARTEHQQM